MLERKKIAKEFQILEIYFSKHQNYENLIQILM